MRLLEVLWDLSPFMVVCIAFIVAALFACVVGAFVAHRRDRRDRREYAVLDVARAVGVVRGEDQ